MKRLLALLGFVCFFVLAAVFYFGELFMWIMLFLFSGFLIVSLIIPKTRREKTLPVAFMAGILCCLWLVSYTAFFVTPVQERFNEREGRVTVTQKSRMYFSGGYYCCEAEIKSIDSETVDAGGLIMSDEPFFSSLYDEISFDSQLFATRRTSYLAEDIKFTVYVFEDSRIEVNSPENKPLLSGISELNTDLENALYMELDLETANFASALLLGNRYNLENEVNTLFRNCGISHIIVVSGLHLSIIAALISKASRGFFRNRYISSACIIIAVLFFGAMTGFGYSMVRAMIVQLVIALGGMFRRRADSLNSLGLAALIIILPNPYAASDVGFQLSLLSTLGIVTLSDRMYKPVASKLSAYKLCRVKPVKAILKVILTTFFTSLSASLMTLPVSALVFGGFSTIAVFVNILVVPIMAFALVLSAICAVFHYVGFLALFVDICAFLLESLYRFIIWVCRLFSSIPYSYIRTDEIYFTLWIGFTMILIGAAIAIGKRRGYILTVFLSLFMLTSSAGVYKMTHEDVLTLRIPDTGGKSVILESASGHCILSLDGSVRKAHRLLEEIEKLPDSDSNIIISCGDWASDSYLSKILTEFEYNTVLRYDNKDNEMPASLENKAIISFDENYLISLWDKAEVYVFAEDDSLYEYIEADNTSVLILPEIGNCLDIPEEFRNPKIVVTESVIKNMGLLSCETLVVAGEGYMGEATANIAAGIAQKVVLDSNIVYDIN